MKMGEKKLMKKIAIIGSGSWGVALGIYLAKNGNQVKIWSFLEEEKDKINNEKKCIYLPNVEIPESIVCSCDFREVLEGAELVLHVTPSKFTRETFKQYKKYVGQDLLLYVQKVLKKKV